MAEDDRDPLDALAGGRPISGLRSPGSRGPGQGGTRLEDLEVDPKALEGNPFAHRTNWQAALRSSGRGWVAAAIAAAVLVLGWQFRTPLSEEVVRSTPGSGVAHLRAAAPSSLKQQIVDDLRAVGVEAIGYDRLGLSGVDAKLPQPVSPAVRAVLESHGIAVPADDTLRVEIAADETQSASE